MYILKCEAFDGEPGLLRPNRCCVGGCHEVLEFIRVTPYAIDATPENKRLDWELGIQAFVCCGRYEFVRALSREWWVKKGVEVGLWDEAKAKSLMHKGSWHKTYEQRSSAVNVAGSGASGKGAARKVASGPGKCPACGSKWSGDVCDNCGHGAGI